jgi:XTP/dITP diphosphohydrolase
MNELLISTANPGKAREFQEMLGNDWTVRTLRDLPGMPDIVEDGATFEENARIKALALPFDGLVLADDSGLEVDALDGAPGVRSARYAGEPKDDRRNLEKLLQVMEPVPDDRRGAQFRCVLVLARGGRVVHVTEGICRGRIARVATGDGGFGYDPVFIPDGRSESFGVLSSEVKHALSHRGAALRRMVDYLKMG